ncbi:MAG: hypothetical protein R2712_11325 [Vicinamibacterales bacterium]
MVAWDGETVGPWQAQLDDAEVVINLAGRSVDCRYDAANRHAILHSRVASTLAVGRAIAQASRPPRVWLQASTATIYAHRFDAPNDEATGRIGAGARRAGVMALQHRRRPAVGGGVRRVHHAAHRKVLLRAGHVVMSPDRGGISIP